MELAALPPGAVLLPEDDTLFPTYWVVGDVVAEPPQDVYVILRPVLCLYPGQETAGGAERMSIWPSEIRFQNQPREAQHRFVLVALPHIDQSTPSGRDAEAAWWNDVTTKPEARVSLTDLGSL